MSACYILSLSFSLPLSLSLSLFLSLSLSLALFRCLMRRSKAYPVLSRVLSSPPLFPHRYRLSLLHFMCFPRYYDRTDAGNGRKSSNRGSFKAPRPARCYRPEFGQYGDYTRLRCLGHHCLPVSRTIPATPTRSAATRSYLALRGRCADADAVTITERRLRS